MADDAAWRRLRTGALAGVAAAALFLIVSTAYPLPIVLGALPIPTAVALGLFVGLAVIATTTPAVSRTPSFDLSPDQLRWILAWWLALGLACMLLAIASWRTWGVLAFLAAIVIALKVISVFGYLKWYYEFRVWLPFAAIIGMGMFLGVVVLFLGRPNMPPPIDAVVAAYGADLVVDGPPSRSPRDLSGAGLTLEASGDTTVGGLPATVSRYRLPDGRAVDVYASQVRFPAPPGADRSTAPAGWSITMGGVQLRAVEAGEHLLVVSPEEMGEAIAQTLADAPSLP